MTLGCGGWGGNITSDNISPRHLLNLKRVAYGLRPPVASAPAPRASTPERPAVSSKPESLPKAPPRPSPTSIPVEALVARVDQFLASRGYRPSEGKPAQPAPADAPQTLPAQHLPQAPVAFVCEEDVRVAQKEGRQIVIGERTIVTPAARDGRGATIESSSAPRPSPESDDLGPFQTSPAGFDSVISCRHTSRRPDDSVAKPVTLTWS
jgi:hypothetical protein